MMTTGAEQGEIAEVGSPVLIPADPVDDVRPLRWTTVVIAGAAMVLALTNGPVAGEWLDAQPPGAATRTARPVVARWGRLTAGLARPHAWVRARWDAARAWRFSDERPGEQGAADVP